MFLFKIFFLPLLSYCNHISIWALNPGFSSATFPLRFQAHQAQLLYRGVCRTHPTQTRREHLDSFTDTAPLELYLLPPSQVSGGTAGVAEGSASCQTDKDTQCPYHCLDTHFFWPFKSNCLLWSQYLTNNRCELFLNFINKISWPIHSIKNDLLSRPIVGTVNFNSTFDCIIPEFQSCPTIKYQ